MGYADFSQLFKDIRSVADTTANTDLNQKILELQGKVMDLFEAQSELKDENKKLKEQLDFHDKISLNESGVIEIDGDSKQYCPHCWGKYRQLNILNPNSKLYSISVYNCASCGKSWKKLEKVIVIKIKLLTKVITHVVAYFYTLKGGVANVMKSQNIPKLTTFNELSENQRKAITLMVTTNY